MRVSIAQLLVFVCKLAADVSWNVEDGCTTECVSDEGSSRIGYDVSCGDTCRLQQCRYGCRMWRSSRNYSCHDICQNQPNRPRVGATYCLVGCNLATTAYIEVIRKKVVIPEAPYLVPETTTNDSITIEWNASDYTNITYLVQWRFDLPPGSWEYYEPEFPLTRNSVKIRGLHPFSRYKFRIAWILLPYYTPLLSAESRTISTLPYGAPTSMPTITRITAISPNHISVNWLPPRFPNGPILSYVLHLSKSPKVLICVKDVVPKNGKLYYAFKDLEPQVVYNISITARNSFGEGPADTKTFKTSTLKENRVDTPFQPWMLLVDGRTLLKHKLEIADVAEVHYQSNNPNAVITGVAIHVKLSLVFVSDSSGSIHCVHMNSGRDITTIVNRRRTYPTLLSMDWLNNLLYMVEEKRVSRCDMKGHNYEVAIQGFLARPIALLADSYHGFLYWIDHSIQNAGLYRIDLSAIDGGDPPSPTDAELILKDRTFNSFAIDYINFRLLIPKSSNNTIVSVSLDGTEEVDIRRNSLYPQFTNIKSFAYHNKLFFWETENRVFGEEYHKKEDKYYHNKYLIDDGSFSHLNIFHPDVQPYPVPLDPVEDVQVVFREEIGKISWKKPKLLDILGKGAWQDWLFEVHLYDHTNGIVKMETNVSSTNCVFYNLYPNTMYSAKVRAFSPREKGPWSLEFFGKTLKPGTSVGYPYIVWSTGSELVASDLLGDGMKLLIPPSYFSHLSIIDVSWYSQLHFLVTNASNAYVHDVETNSLSLISGITNVMAVAVDWLSPKLYWSTPVRHMIFRTNLDGSQPEYFPFLTVARDIAVDSLNAYLYWISACSVECSRLNGLQRTIIFETGLFSGKYVIGIVLDFDTHSIYWMLKSFEGSLLYKASFTSEQRNSKDSVEAVGSLSEHDVQGPFSLYSERLYWLLDSKQPVISNMTGQSIAHLKEWKAKKFFTLTIVDPSLHPSPDGRRRRQVNVVPAQVNANEIIIVGTSTNFNITWKPDRSVTFGTVFYEISLQMKGKSHTVVTEQSYYKFRLGNLPPYTPLNISIRAYTFWASSNCAAVSLHSPMSVPTQPVSPRVFISYKRELFSSTYQIDAEFRWSPPRHHNGIILGYYVNSWYEHEGRHIPSVQNLKVPADTLSSVSINVFPNTTYYFKVHAFNDAGNSPSVIVQTNTSIETPVPKILLAKADSVKVADVDTQEERVLSNRASDPVDIACLAREGIVFWLEESGFLMSSNLNGSNIKIICSLPYNGTSLTVDWITRKLYWTQVETNFGSIWMLDLNYAAKPQIIVNMTSAIAAVEVEPFTGLLYWTQVDNKGVGQLMLSDTNGSNIRQFFRGRYSSLQQHERNRAKRNPMIEACSCPTAPIVGKPITIDYSDADKPQIIWVEGTTGHIWSSDAHACICFPLIYHQMKKYIGLPPSSITVDKSKVYWLDSSKTVLYSATKQGPNSQYHTLDSLLRDLRKELTGNIRGIRAVVDSLQPLPDKNCLFPEEYNEIPSLVSATPSTLVLHLHPPKIPPSCNIVSTSAFLYTVYYKKVEHVTEINAAYLQDALTKESYNSTVTIDGLLPYVNYSVQVSISNSYSVNETKGPITFFHTKEGVPTAPTNIRAVTASPNDIILFWEPPKRRTGGAVVYEIKQRSDNRTNVLTLSTQLSSVNGVYQESLSSLNPSTKYYFVVRAYSQDNRSYSDSYEVTNSTYHHPSNIQLVKSESSSLSLQWISPMESMYRHTLKVTEVESTQEHFKQTYQTSPNVRYSFIIENLKPRTQYSVKLILEYSPFNTTYTHPQGGTGFIFETIGRKPNTPGIPYIKSLGTDAYQVVWDGVESFKGETITYELQFMSLGKDGSLPPSQWSTPIVIPTTQWIIKGLPAKSTYIFRVRAHNDYGNSNHSLPSTEFFLPENGGILDPDDENMAIILASLLAVVILITIIFIAGICIANSQNKKLKANANTDLATLHALPQNGNFVHETNELYNVGTLDDDDDLSDSPQIRREQIVLTKLLGRGAFGEVFEGIAHELRGEGTPPVRVAVKTLRKGATEQEKTGFLKEAKLMSNFNHEHILKLLGVCLDNNLNFIILELMEAGDLLMYLRNHRPTTTSPSPLKLYDLMSICVDVASGCKYLEDMHFVHRDLAARNCLVSGYNSETRIVKIGDFGLARDVYKNDYYRKEGEGLLPVRWLAPESLVDGVFTTQSDVWAFGVLLWEVMTLGQQPYPARSNLEVLHYVRDGGHLDKPLNCPDDFFELMLLCWSYNPFHRPTFSHCLPHLEELREITTNRQISFTSVHNHMYYSSVTTDDDSSGLLIRENYIFGEHSGTSTSTDNNHQENPNVNRTRSRTLQTENSPSNLSSTGLECGIWHTSYLGANIPRKTVSYLELLPDQFLPQQPAYDDGYEVPIQVQSCHSRAYGRISQCSATFNERGNEDNLNST